MKKFLTVLMIGSAFMASTLTAHAEEGKDAKPAKEAKGKKGEKKEEKKEEAK